MTSPSGHSAPDLPRSSSCAGDLLLRLGSHGDVIFDIESIIADMADRILDPQLAFASDDLLLAALGPLPLAQLR